MGEELRAVCMGGIRPRDPAEAVVAGLGKKEKKESSGL